MRENVAAEHSTLKALKHWLISRPSQTMLCARRRSDEIWWCKGRLWMKISTTERRNVGNYQWEVITNAGKCDLFISHWPSLRKNLWIKGYRTRKIIITQTGRQVNKCSVSVLKEMSWVLQVEELFKLISSGSRIFQRIFQLLKNLQVIKVIEFHVIFDILFVLTKLYSIILLLMQNSTNDNPLFSQQSLIQHTLIMYE